MASWGERKRPGGFRKCLSFLLGLLSLGARPDADGREGDAREAGAGKGALSSAANHFPDQRTSATCPQPTAQGNPVHSWSPLRGFGFCADGQPPGENSCFQEHLCLQRKCPQLCCPLALLTCLWSSARDPGGRPKRLCYVSTKLLAGTSRWSLLLPPGWRPLRRTTHWHRSLSARLVTTWLGSTNSKHGDLNSVPRTHEKSQAWSHWGDRDGQILGARWLVSTANLVTPRPVRGAVSKAKCLVLPCVMTLSGLHSCTPKKCVP